MDIESSSGDQVGRRRLLAGAGVAAIAGLTAANASSAAAGGDTGPEGSPSPQGDLEGGGNVIDATPVTSTLGSPPVNGFNYRSLTWIDFSPLPISAGWVWGGWGCYSPAGAWAYAAVDIPAGARVRDVEWYAVHNADGNLQPAAFVWSSEEAGLDHLVASSTFSTRSTSIQASRAVVSSADYGPFPLGCKLMLSFPSYDGDKSQLNGVRVGFSNGGGSTGMMQSPERVYDSRSSGGRLSANSTRTITLPLAYCPVGSTGVIVNVTAIEPDAAGYLRVWPGQTSSTDTSVVSFRPGANTSNAVTVGVSTARTIKVRASQRTHLAVDVFGWIG